MSRRTIRIKSRTGGDAKRAIDQVCQAVSQVPSDVDLDVDIDTTLPRSGKTSNKSHEEREREAALLNKGNARLDQENAQLDEEAEAERESGRSPADSYRESIQPRKKLRGLLESFRKAGGKISVGVIVAYIKSKLGL